MKIIVQFNHNGICMKHIHVKGTKRYPLFLAMDVYEAIGSKNIQYHNFTRDFDKSEMKGMEGSENLTKKGVFKLISKMKSKFNWGIIDIFENWIKQLFKDINIYGLIPSLLDRSPYNLITTEIKNENCVMYIFQADDILKFGFTTSYRLHYHISQHIKIFPFGQLIFQQDIFNVYDDEIETMMAYLDLKCRNLLTTGGYNISVEECKMCLLNLVLDLKLYESNNDFEIKPRKHSI
jgi:hypothetical protein